MPYTLVLPEEQCARREPGNLRPQDAVLFAHEYRKRFRPVAAETLSIVGVLPNGFLHRSTVPLVQSFAVQPRGRRMAKVIGTSLFYRALCRRVVNVERGLYSTDEFSNGFFHWICDVLPRIEALAADSPEELATRKLIVPAMADFPYVVPSLAPFRVGGLEVLGKNQRAACDTLLVLPAVAPTGNYRPGLMRALRERFRSFFGTPAGARRIFISRAEAPWRKIANEDEILPLLSRHGFERIVLERLSFPEQVALVASASILAGNHGAGLTNMIWMSPGTRVLELRRRDDRENNCYFSLASALDLPYYYMQCDGVRRGTATHKADVLVNPAELSTLLQRLD